jgi:hypothetical protein
MLFFFSRQLGRQRRTNCMFSSTVGEYIVVRTSSPQGMTTAPHRQFHGVAQDIAFESFGNLVEVVHNGPMRTSNQRYRGNAMTRLRMLLKLTANENLHAWHIQGSTRHVNEKDNTASSVLQPRTSANGRTYRVFRFMRVSRSIRASGRTDGSTIDCATLRNKESTYNEDHGACAVSFICYRCTAVPKQEGIVMLQTTP